MHLLKKNILGATLFLGTIFTGAFATITDQQPAPTAQSIKEMLFKEMAKQNISFEDIIVQKYFAVPNSESMFYAISKNDNENSFYIRILQEINQDTFEDPTEQKAVNTLLNIANAPTPHDVKIVFAQPVHDYIEKKKEKLAQLKAGDNCIQGISDFSVDQNSEEIILLEKHIKRAQEIVKLNSLKDVLTALAAQETMNCVPDTISINNEEPCCLKTFKQQAPDIASFLLDEYKSHSIEALKEMVVNKAGDLEIFFMKLF